MEASGIASLIVNGVQAVGSAGTNVWYAITGVNDTRRRQAAAEKLALDNANLSSSVDNLLMSKGFAPLPKSLGSDYGKYIIGGIGLVILIALIRRNSTDSRRVARERRRR